MKQQSEFGKGFVYNLILFAKHFENDMSQYGRKKKSMWYWFSGASDHLYEIEVPKQWAKTVIGKKVKELQDTALRIGHGGASSFDGKDYEKDFDRCLELTKQIGILVDKKLGLKPVKGDFE
jgi:hypothetical protein